MDDTQFYTATCEDCRDQFVTEDRSAKVCSSCRLKWGAINNRGALMDNPVPTTPKPKSNLPTRGATVSAQEFLGDARKEMDDRASTYDRAGGERSMGSTITAFNAITNRDLTESEGWLIMQLLKDVRQFSRDAYHEDSAVDCVAYAALKAEALSGGL